MFMISDYRIIKVDEKYTVNLVNYDNDQNPISKDIAVVEADSINDMTLVLVYMLSALTKPTLDSQVFDPLSVEDSDITTALSLMRNNNDS